MKKIKLLNFLFELIAATFYNCWAFALLKKDSDISELAKLFGLFLLTQALFQVPTGYFADRYGKKQSVITGLVLFILGSVIISTNAYLIAGFLLIGTSFSFLDGAKSAWFRELASKETNFECEKQDTKFYFSLDLVGRFATAIGSYAGVRIAASNPPLFWIGLSLIALGLALYAAKQPNGSIVSREEFKLRARLKLNSLSLLLITFFIGSLFYGVEYGLRNLIWQPYLDKLTNGNTAYFGVFFVFVSIARILGNLSYKILPKFFKENLSSMVLIPLVVFAAAQFNASGSLTFFQFAIPYAIAVFFLGMFFPARETLLNRLIDDRWRATGLSIDSMIWLGTGSIILLSLSARQNIDLNFLWKVSSLAILICGCLYCFSSKRKK
ncbi:MAG: MFS transporter [Parvularculaceae bacterium]